MKFITKEGETIEINRFTKDMQVFGKNGKEIKFKFKPVEPKILALVEALNDTKLLKTFSSCQGHFLGTDQKLQDRNFADVRFEILPGVSENELETFIGDLTVKFSYLENSPVHLNSYKKICAKDDFIYVLMLIPKDRFDHPAVKRKYTDHAINVLTGFVRDFIALKQKTGAGGS